MSKNYYILYSWKFSPGENFTPLLSAITGEIFIPQSFYPVLTPMAPFTSWAKIFLTGRDFYLTYM